MIVPPTFPTVGRTPSACFIQYDLSIFLRKVFSGAISGHGAINQRETCLFTLLYYHGVESDWVSGVEDWAALHRTAGRVSP